MKKNEFSAELEAAQKAIKSAGEILKKYIHESFHVVRKSLHEMVGEVDIKSQKVIIDQLAPKFPKYKIISEEKSKQELGDGLYWIIDPLDGTHNYIAGLPFSGISIGLADKDNFYLGVIYFPMEDRLYTAVKGCGAFCNGKKITVSNNDSLGKAIVNYDNQFHLSENSFDNLKKIAEKAFTVRIFGTATADACFISKGRIDARIWNATKIVDIAAGAVIVTEAGGKVTNFRGEKCGLTVKDVVASNGLIHAQVLHVLNSK